MALTCPAAAPDLRPDRARSAMHRGRQAPMRKVGSSTNQAARANTTATMENHPVNECTCRMPT